MVRFTERDFQEPSPISHQSNDQRCLVIQVEIPVLVPTRISSERENFTAHEPLALASLFLQKFHIAPLINFNCHSSVITSGRESENQSENSLDFNARWKMYTNWLTSEVPTKTCETGNPLPDVIVEVGPLPFSRFSAHSTVLSSHSGFFRAALTRASELGKLSDNCIYLPNITVEHFTPLLSYMYTGYLELTFENIFGVLLATHLLHMPRALEICRDFLAHTQRQQSDFYSAAVPTLTTSGTASKVVRPIASKASNVGLNFVSPPKAPSSLLFPSHGTPFKSFAISPSTEIAPKVMKLSEPKIEAQPTNDRSLRHKTPPVKPVAVQSNRKLTENVQTSCESDKVIIDIASCDGPVRFRRILNEAFEKNKKQILLPSSESLNDVKYHQSNVLSFHQQMVKNINEQYSKNKSNSSQNSEESENSQHSGDLYTCVYCNHTFKSKYCYQKHAKRHLNPLNSIGKCRDDCESSDGDVKKTVNETSTVKRDSIKPLDMNVQYYPCKTCGCKFPSYYFVHKHRKMCHPEIAADGSVQGVQSEVSEENEGSLVKNAADDEIRD